jgi:hypothetical protein
MTNTTNETSEHVTELSDQVLSFVQALLKDGANPHALAAVLIGAGGDLLRHTTSVEYAARTMNQAAIELARTAMSEKSATSTKH